MKPVDQTKFGRLAGNCMQACIASILEIPIEEAFDSSPYGPGKEWWNPFQEWCEDHGLGVLYFDHDSQTIIGNCYGIACVSLEGVDEGHAVVGKYEMFSVGDVLHWRMTVEHNPNPRNCPPIKEVHSHIVIWRGGCTMNS
jgi:hypothetical protein